MRVLIVGVATVAALLLVACGGLSDCASFRGEGQCRSKMSGITYQIVNRGHTLQLPSMSVKLDSITKRHLLSYGKGNKLRPDNGTMWAVASVTLTNRLQSPQTYSRDGQMILELGPSGQPFGEDALSLPNTCLANAGLRAPLPPGKSVTCNVLFDVGTNAANLFLRGNYSGQRGGLVVVNFGNSTANLGYLRDISPPRQPVGVIRLTP